MKKIFLKDYQPAGFEIEWVNLEFDLQENLVAVKNHMSLKRKSAGPLVLNGEKLQLVSVALNGRALASSEYLLNSESLTFEKLPDQFELEIVTQFNPKENTELTGLYYSGGVLCTQCEAEGFRRITYFLDRPDVMTTYHVTLRADKAKFPILLSNGNRMTHKDLPGGFHQLEWEDPFKKPSYLFALVAGDLGLVRDSFTTMSQREINLEIYAPHGKQNLCHHAMRSLKKALRWDEERFGREYDLDDYMIVSIDDFNMGAMENKGLNIFNSRLVLADENSATDDEFHRIESVVGHEYFHNWTGNRVTVRDWFHLSLKEGLTVFRDQEFSADMTDIDIQRISDVSDLRERQFTEDAGPNAHPVRPESCYSVDNFYTSTIYEKGSEIIRMMAVMTGRAGFRRGMDLYFSRHDGQAVTIEDFVKAISEPNKKNWDQFRLWYAQAGTPVVEVKEAYDEGSKEFHLHFKQTCPATPGQDSKMPFHIPMTFELFEKTGKLFDIHSDEISRNSEGQKVIELKEAEATFKFRDIGSRPILSLLRGFSAPVHLKWDRPDADLFFLMTKDSDGFNRREASSDLAMKLFKSSLAEIRLGKSPSPSGAFIEAFKAILDDQSLTPAFKARMLTLPSENYLIQKEELFDAENYLKMRQWIFQFLGQKFAPELERIYSQYHGKNSKSVEFDAASMRSLKYRALVYWIQSGDKRALEVATKQYKTAENMTDRIQALAALSMTDSPFFDELLEDFHKVWRSDSLVLNKWFYLQATGLRSDVFSRVKKLVDHPDFHIKNPNNVYSLLGGFVGNASVFHSLGNAAYNYLMDLILKIDEINPQVAARICTIFDFYRKMPERSKADLKVLAGRALQHPKLSKNTRELLEPVLSF